MKLISLNTYCGNVFEPMMAFVRSHAKTTNVFCFQEIISALKPNIPPESHGARTNLLQELEVALPDFQALFAPMQDGFDAVELVPLPIECGTAMFVRRKYEVLDSGSFFISGRRNGLVGRDYATLGYNAIYSEMNVHGTPLTLLSLHGISEPADKLDSPERLRQSKTILDFLAQIEGEKIVMGDFNLMPNTESIRMFEDAGMRNLIKEYGIKTTRGTMNRTLHPEYEHGKYGFQEFADYTFVSPGIHVNTFTVPDAGISDHLPMILDFNLPNRPSTS